MNPELIKSENCISTIVLNPPILIPYDAESIEDSHKGVLKTLFLPYLPINPSVILKTPPYSAMSCPIITRLSCSSIASSIPFLIESTNLMFSEVFELLAIVVALYSLKTSESSFC